MEMAKKGYIEREAFLEQKREQYCKDCARRKGMRNGKHKTLYEIGEAPCRACEIDDVLNDVEGFPAADVRPVVRGKWTGNKRHQSCSECHMTYCVPDGQDGELDLTAYHFCPNCGARMEES